MSARRLERERFAAGHEPEMTELHGLPPDQRAVLSLVLDRGKSYAEVASLLSIPEATVRERAHAALDALGADRQAAGVAARAGDARADDARTGDAHSATPGAADRTEPGATDRTQPGAANRALSRLEPSSRRGGAVLLAGLVVAIVVAVVLLASGGKGGGNGSAATATTTAPTGSASTSASSGAKPRIDKKLTLSAVEPESRAGGEAYVLSDGSRRAFYVAARGLAASHGFFYAVWLYNSPSSSAPLGRAPGVGSDGRLEGGGPLPNNAGDYAKLIVTRETNTRARHPGTIVLSGSFSLR